MSQNLREGVRMRAEIVDQLDPLFMLDDRRTDALEAVFESVAHGFKRSRLFLGAHESRMLFGIFANFTHEGLGLSPGLGFDRCCRLTGIFLFDDLSGVPTGTSIDV